MGASKFSPGPIAIAATPAGTAGGGSGRALYAGLAVTGALMAVASAGLAQAAGIEPRETPDIPRPAYLQRMIDPVFGTTVLRITDAGNPIANPTGDPSLDGRSWERETGHAYSSRSAWNADQSLMILEKGVSGSVYLDGATYAPLFRRDWPGDLRWHPTDPETVLFVNNEHKCLGAYRPRSDSFAWRRCLAGYDSLEWGDPGKGKPSLDGTIMPLRAQRSGDKHWVAFLYHIDSETVTPEIDMSRYTEAGDSPDFVMSPKGDTIVVVGCLKGHTGRCEAQMGVDVATGKELWRTNNYHDPGHADEAVDANGEQWRIGVSKEGPFKGQIIKRNFRTGEAVSLIPYWGSHTSTRDIHAARNIAVVTFDDPSGSPLQGEIDGVCIDGSCFERYAHTHRSGGKRYLAENHGSISPLGNRIVFRSDWGDPNGPIDSYVIELPDAR